MSSAHSKKNDDGDHPLNPRTSEYEWAGPLGAFFLVLSLPATVLIMNALCTAEKCSLTLSSINDLIPATQHLVKYHAHNVLLGVQLYVAWIFFHCVVYLLPIGSREQGMPLRNGRVLTYNINALHSMIITYMVAFGGHFSGAFDLGVLADLFIPLALASIIVSCTLAVLLYLASFRSSDVLLALGGNSGSPFYDFWVGRELNPRIGALDLKFMFELRPGLIGWTLLCWGFVVRAHQQGSLTISLPLVALFQTSYVVDALWYEAGNATMMDIVHDGFGFMLAFGDLSWVPFLYTLQCRYIYLHPIGLPSLYVIFCVALHLTGYYIFRRSNSEKDRFRKNPNDPRVSHLRVMKTSAGKSLIISGCWGVCRHPNYVGDWIMTLSWSMLTGWATLLPYFHPAYFAVLLIHRQLRDEHQMKLKYGEKDWKEFCKLVPYRLIPYVY